MILPIFTAAKLTLVVLQSAEESIWTEHSNLTTTWSGDSYTYTDVYKSLDVLEDYVKAQVSMFGSVDHVALFTG